MIRCTEASLKSPEPGALGLLYTPSWHKCDLLLCLDKLQSLIHAYNKATKWRLQRQWDLKIYKTLHGCEPNAGENAKYILSYQDYMLKGFINFD